MTNQKMTMTNLFLVAFAGLCLAIALAIAWVLGVTLFFPMASWPDTSSNGPTLSGPISTI